MQPVEIHKEDMSRIKNFTSGYLENFIETVDNDFLQIVIIAKSDWDKTTHSDFCCEDEDGL